MKELDNETKYEIAEKLLEKVENWDSIKYTGGRPEKVFIQVKIKNLCSLFNIDKRTLNRWILSGRLNPRSLFSVCSLYSALFSGQERKEQ